MAIDKRKQEAKNFAEYWKDKGYEKGQSQQYWNMLLRDVLGIEKPELFIEYEDQVLMDKSTGFIDGYIPSTKVLIEQKSKEKSLKSAIKQSDGTLLTPFQQAKKYIVDLPVSKHPKWVITCNFQEMYIYNMENPKGEPETIKLEDLEKEYYRLSFIVDAEKEHLKREMELSVKAGELVGLIYDAFKEQYISFDEHAQQSLNKLCVRLVFCLYAEDAGLFKRKNQFHDYLAKYDINAFRQALIDLFKILDTKEEERDPYLDKDLLDFPYVNGGLFSDENVIVPTVTKQIKELLLTQASDDFNWSEISPTIFGAVFESTLNPETRRSGGMHYTSIENIHKVIDPLFLSELKAELEEIKQLKQKNQIEKRVREYQNKLATLTFLDPAAGSGNFLTETFISLRKLENEALMFARSDGSIQLVFGDINELIKVHINQFYGIEINDFAVSVAQTALWIAEHQMLRKTEELFYVNMDFLPLKSYTNIIEGNALTMDWNCVISANKLSYIMGNPPFIGSRIMDKKQKRDLTLLLKGFKNVGNLDYVAGWYYKSQEYINDNPKIRAALVSTNSITQGEQVALLWKPLIERYNIKIDYAYRTFIWDSEANDKAHVHCVIIGFSHESLKTKKTIYNGTQVKYAENINGYLVDAPNVFIETRSNPLCAVPTIGMGNQPIDGGFYLFEEDEMNSFIAKEPEAKKYFVKWIGSREFINRKNRYCLLLKDVDPAQLLRMPLCMERVKMVREYRLQSPSEPTRQLALTPLKFNHENFPDNTYIVIPEVSSERRKYIPIGFLSPDVICSNLVKMIPNANVYHFGILTSNVHMSWVRYVCGRLKSDYRYSAQVVYNNFPWPSPTHDQIEKIKKTGRAILDARDKYPTSSFADMYGEAMYLYPELLKAHQENDKAVMEAYGFDWHTMSESECVVELMKMYQQLTDK